MKGPVQTYRRIAFPVSFISLVPVFVLVPALFLALQPILVFHVRQADGRDSIFCSETGTGEQILYRSENSIYSVPVEEMWRVDSDGYLAVVHVDSTHSVIDYYGIESYSPLGAGIVRGFPTERRFDRIHMMVGARGQQRIIVRGKELDLFSMPEGTSLSVSLEKVPRIVACR